MKKTLKSSVFLILFCVHIPIQIFAQTGKDGVETISSTGVIFNRYTTLAASASIGNTSITVANSADLSASAISGAANNPYATASLAYGDLIMIIKMQGATINTTNTVNYGTVTALNNTGVYELKVVRNVSGNLITFCSGLANNFTIGGTQRVQVIRIPRLSALTVNAGASLTAPAWGSSFTGGIVAIEVTGNLTLNGSITVAGLGYRGGVVDNNTTAPPSTVNNYVNSSSNDGAEKGESIAGFQADYDGLNGRYDRGAPANGGGGGNAHNAGGGGGANGNNGNTWTGQGVMVTNGSNPLSAWQLDPGYIANGNSLTNSSGGGRGGYTYGANNQNATTTGPGNSGWGGDNRREVGGLGGRPLTYSSNTLYMGGGGGAGDGNNNAAQNGASGGGIIYLHVTGNISGTGSINANGATAGNTISGGNDAPGGGGGGGAIRLNVQGTISSLTISANGGAGGNQVISGNESEGPGGGGGGGHIWTTGTPVLSVTAGSAGTTNSGAVTEFTFNGATSGAAGATLTNQTFVAAPALSCFPLPVTLVSFDARLSTNKEGILYWVAENETNLSNYVVEQSDDGRNWQYFTAIAARNASGRQAYSVNTGLVTKTTYYRLKIVDADQSSSYSTIKLLTNQGKTRLLISGSSIYFTGIPATAKRAEIINSTGVLVWQKELSGEQTLTITNENFAAGIYFLRLYAATGSQEVFPFIR